MNPFKVNQQHTIHDSSGLLEQGPSARLRGGWHWTELLKYLLRVRRKSLTANRVHRDHGGGISHLPAYRLGFEPGYLPARVQPIESSASLFSRLVTAFGTEINAKDDAVRDLALAKRQKNEGTHDRESCGTHASVGTVDRIELPSSAAKTENLSTNYNAMKTLDLKTLSEAVTKSAAAFRAHLELQPAGGPGSKIFPSTYEGGKYATEGPRYTDTGGGQKEISGYDRVLLDSVQSQANRSELALLAAWERAELKLPVVTVDFAGNDLPRSLRITSLEAPHRIADALLRDSLHPTEKVAFRKSSVGKVLDQMDTRNASPLFQYCPTALIFGLWDSTGPKGGGGAKFARAMTSEIVGHDVQVGVKTSSRLDPAQIQLAAGPLFENEVGGWTLNEAEARKTKGKALKLGKDGRPSEANHGNVMPSITSGGVTISRAVQTVVLSLTALRRLSFPLKGNRPKPTSDDAARVALAALGLCAATLASEQNQDLRSRCQLFPTAPFVWELLDEPGIEPKKFTLSRAEAISLYQEALEAAKKAGLPVAEEELVLIPSPQLIALVRRSQELSAAQTEDSEVEGVGAK